MSTKKELQLLRNAIHYLDYAIEDLVEDELHSRSHRLYLALMRPKALFVAMLGLSLLTVLFSIWLHSISLGFSVALISYFFLLGLYILRLPKPQDRQLFLKNINSSDELIMEVGDANLLRWPLSHPEDKKDEEIHFKELEKWIIARRQQLEKYLLESIVSYKLQLKENKEKTPTQETIPSTVELKPIIPPKLLRYKQSPEYLKDRFETFSKNEKK